MNAPIYEVVDYTDEEQYFTLGWFPDMPAARLMLDLCKEPSDIPTLENDRDEYCKVQILRRVLGWSGNGVLVYEREFTKQYDEEKDEYYWVGAGKVVTP